MIQIVICLFTKIQFFFKKNSHFRPLSWKHCKVWKFHVGGGLLRKEIPGIIVIGHKLHNDAILSIL